MNSILFQSVLSYFHSPRLPHKMNVKSKFLLHSASNITIIETILPSKNLKKYNLEENYFFYFFMFFFTEEFRHILIPKFWTKYPQIWDPKVTKFCSEKKKRNCFFANEDPKTMFFED